MHVSVYRQRLARDSPIAGPASAVCPSKCSHHSFGSGHAASTQSRHACPTNPSSTHSVGLSQPTPPPPSTSIPPSLPSSAIASSVPSSAVASQVPSSAVAPSVPSGSVASSVPSSAVAPSVPSGSVAPRCHPAPLSRRSSRSSRHPLRAGPPPRRLSIRGHRRWTRRRWRPGFPARRHPRSSRAPQWNS